VIISDIDCCWVFPVNPVVVEQRIKFRPICL
jgi:hypothetical protein